MLYILAVPWLRELTLFVQPLGCWEGWQARG